MKQRLSLVFIVLGLTILFSLPQESFGAITVDTGNIQSTGAEGDPITNVFGGDFTIGAGSDVAIIVMVCVESGEDVVAVDWGATSLSEETASLQSGVGNAEIWYAQIGDLGSPRSDEIDVDLSASKKIVIGAIGLFGVHQTSIVDNEGTDESDSADPEVQFTTNFAGSISMEAFCAEDVGVSENSGQDNEDWDISNSVKGAGYRKILGSAGPETFALDKTDDGKKHAYVSSNHIKVKWFSECMIYCNN